MIARLTGSLRARIVLAALAAITVAGLAAGFAVLAAVERDGRQQVDEALRERADRVVGPRGRPGFPPPPPGGRDRDRDGRGPDRLLAGSGSFVQLELDGRLVQQGGDVPGDAPAIPDRDGLATIGIGGQDWRSYTTTAGPLRLQVLTSLADVEERVADTRRTILVVGLLALLGTGLAAWGFTTLTLRPLERLREQAATIGSTDGRTPLPADGPDEVRSLAATLNGMLDRLEASAEAQRRALEATRRFAADAGHELRTPLTGLRTTLESLRRNPGLDPRERDALLGETVAEQERMVHLLDGLSALARGEAAQSLPREDVELGDLLDTVVMAARRRHPGIDLRVADDLGDLVVHGWPGGLRLVLDNLVDNAALHGGTQVDVVARPCDDGRLLVAVTDDGPGIPAAERERLLEPFARGAGVQAPGSGLGLAIVAQQVALHGGELAFDDVDPHGLRVEVRLPTAPGSPAGAPAAGGTSR